jgi:flagellar biosynthetic protein FliR
VIGIILEVFQSAAQLISLQAGFAYASTIDPTSGADSPVLVTTAQLTAAILFFCSGTEGVFLRALAERYRLVDARCGKVPIGAGAAIQHFASLIFVSGLRLAAPVMMLLLLADLLLAVFGRLQPALQLTSLTFPVKLAASMLLLSPIVRLYPRFFSDLFAQGFGLMEHLFVGGQAGG